MCLFEELERGLRGFFLFSRLVYIPPSLANAFLSFFFLSLSYPLRLNRDVLDSGAPSFVTLGRLQGRLDVEGIGISKDFESRVKHKVI